MKDEILIKKYLPMTETAYYILLALVTPRHGYGIMQHVTKITNQRVKLGAGTIYGSLSKMEKDQIIVPVEEEDRRKIYIISSQGEKLLELEMFRLQELLENGRKGRR
ncbi:PadR family transcriptional regulator [Candidatus Contubernalis alkaliaceticus]|uniref:PadR family transcriptional regulator n=1 Tax=Candidatus Contubernalis alkaliaceticus TaxID=338645 RepID=UPI001F4C0563|nr:PadR family transcriptional regulator [Candidatus Contubernalis alkalaceticus]UNC91062.1 PadR family transcriptional regulator [Candidatus Contubernalis alkalaceticus]